MTSNLNYSFIHASPGEVRGAWQRWTGTSQDAYFIPAQGGCFLVELNAAVYSNPIAWLHTKADALGHKLPDVERFKKDFESGLI